MSSFLWKNLKPDQSPDPCCSAPGFRSSRSACLRPACCRHFRSCRGLSVMEEQKQLCLCLQLHLHMRPLHLQPAAALTAALRTLTNTGRRRAAAFKPKSDHVSVERSAGNTNTQHVSASTMHPLHRLLFWKIQYFPEGQLRSRLLFMETPQTGQTSRKYLV